MKSLSKEDVILWAKVILIFSAIFLLDMLVYKMF